MEMWEKSIMRFMEAGFALLMFVVARRVSNRNARILRFIEQKGI
jgi:hypothetical protein